jgi:hypothetical protein
LQTQMNLQSELEREKNKNKFLSEQLEEVLWRNEQELEAKIEVTKNQN